MQLKHSDDHSPMRMYLIKAEVQPDIAPPQPRLLLAYKNNQAYVTIKALRSPLQKPQFVSLNKSRQAKLCFYANLNALSSSMHIILPISQCF